jgi:HEAT repeat protein
MERLRAAAKGADLDEELLTKAKIGIDGRSLLVYLRKQSGKDADFLQLNQLIRQLGDSNFKIREQATKKIIGLGTGIIRPLLIACNDQSPEVAKRATMCIKAVDKDFDWGLPIAAVRQLLKTKPAGTFETLLRYLPYAVDQETEEEICFALDALVVQKGKAHPCLVLALKDPLWARRAIAGCILGRRGSLGQRKSVRTLLNDLHAEVRLRAAQGLLAGGDDSGIPTLIGLLEEPAMEIAWQAEELLHWAAGEAAHQEVVGAQERDQAKKCRSVWQSWWRRQKQINFVKLFREPRRPGLLLLCEPGEEEKPTGLVWLCGCDSRPRWKLSGLHWPFDVQWLGANRVLLGEMGRFRYSFTEKERPVSIRDLKGRVLWRKTVYNDLLHTCRMLPNGNTFVIGYRNLAEFAPDGMETYIQFHRCKPQIKALHGGLRISKARALGTLAGHHNTVVEINPFTGRHIRKAVLSDEIDGGGGQVLILANGHALVAIKGWRLMTETKSRTNRNSIPPGKVFETDARGKILWHCRCARACAPLGKLRNGNALVYCTETVETSVIEIDPTGKTVWEAAGFTSHIRRCEPCFGLLRLGFDKPRPLGFDLDSVPYLINALKQQNVTSRRRAARRLGELAPNLEQAVPALIDALNDQDRDICTEIATVLHGMKEKVRPALFKGLASPHAKIRIACLNLIGQQPGKVPGLLAKLKEAMKDRNPAVRTMATVAMGMKLDDRKDLLPVLGVALKDQDKQVRLSAIGAVARPLARALVPNLLEMLNGKDEEERAAIINTLGLNSPKDEKVISLFVQTLKNRKYTRSRVEAALALRASGKAAKQAVPFLVDMLKNWEDLPDKKGGLPSAVLKALSGIGPSAEEAVPVLMAIMHAHIKGKNGTRSPEDTDLLFKVIDCLSAIGPSAAKARPLLSTLRADPNKKLRKAAETAMARTY